MSSAVHHTISLIIMWQIFIISFPIKCKFQNFHPRISALLQKLSDTRHNHAQIFCNHLCIPNCFINGFDQLFSGSLSKCSIYRYPFCRNSIISYNPNKMINSHNIIHTACCFNTLFPPGKMILFHNIPIINGISPFLSVIRKCIRRTPSHVNRVKCLIQLILSRICPHIGTIQCHINRDISNNLYSLLICIFL